MMNCHDAREHFSGWVDEALAAEERTTLAAHLAECSDCRRELARFQATVGLLPRVEPPRAPAGFVDRVLDLTRPTSWHRRFLQRLFFPLPVKLPAEVAALLLVAGLAVYVFHETPELQQAVRPPEVSQPAARVDAPAAPVPAQAVAPPDARPTPQFRAPAKLQGSVQPEEDVAKPPASPPASQEVAKTRTAAVPPSPVAPLSVAAPLSAAAPPSATTPPPAPSVEAKKEMRDEGPGVPRASEPAPTPPRLAPAVYLELKNSKDHRLGMPLPKGKVRVYKADASGSQQLIGEDSIDHTPKDERVKLKIGDAFDVVGERVQKDWKKIASSLYEVEWEISLRNHKQEDVTVEVIEPVPGDWEVLRSTLPHEKVDAFTMRFRVPVKKDGETKLVYRVRVRF